MGNSSSISSAQSRSPPTTSLAFTWGSFSWSNLTANCESFPRLHNTITVNNSNITDQFEAASALLETAEAEAQTNLGESPLQVEKGDLAAPSEEYLAKK